MKCFKIRMGMAALLLMGALGISLFASAATAEAPYRVAWSRQLGTSAGDYSRSVAVDASGTAYISGETRGSLGGTFAGGLSDAFLAKYDPNGTLLWAEQLGTSDSDYSYSVAVDASGNAFISGFTFGILGAASAGGWDAFLSKYDPNGAVLWTAQLGTSFSDKSYSVAVDSSGNAFISGKTFGSLSGTNAGSSDAFLAKYDPNGTLLWIEQLGTSDSDYSYSVAVDGYGNAFTSGHTNGSLAGTSAGTWDAFLAKYDANGNWLWTEQLGTSEFESSHSVAMDASGNALLSGSTRGSLGGANVGDYDVFLVKFAPCEYVLAGDLDGNCKVDLADFALIVAPADFTPIAANWLIDCFADPVDPACVPIP